MRRISKLNTNIIGEFDTFPNKLYYITLTDKWFATIVRLITEKEKGIDNGKAKTVYDSSIYGDASGTTSRLFNRIKRLYYTPGILMDETLYTRLCNDKNKGAILTILLYYCGVNYTRGVIVDVKQWKINIDDLLSVVVINNHDLSLSLIDDSSSSSDLNKLKLDSVLFGLDCDEVNKLQVNVNGIERRPAVIASSGSLGYLLNNSILTCNNSNTKYRFYRKSYVPTGSTVLSSKSYYNPLVPECKFNNYLFSIISENEYSVISKENSFKRISEKSRLFDEKSNQKTNLDDLIIGHIYSLPIADKLENYSDSTAIMPAGFNAAIQAVYLGKISVKDKPEFLMNNERNSKSSFEDWKTCFRFGNSLVYLNKDLLISKLRSIASGGSLKTSTGSNLEIHLFFNIGQLAKFNETDRNFYTINVDDLNTKEKFIDYIADVLIPDTINIVKCLTGDVSLDYFNEQGLPSYIRSSITVHSPSIITLINSDIEPENPITDLGELFSGDGGFDLEMMLNRITVRSIEELKKEGKEFQISSDVCLTANSDKPSFLSSSLPFLAWVTPDLYNNNPEVKQSIINVLKRDIYIATSLLIFQLPLVCQRLRKSYSIPSRLKEPAEMFNKIDKLQVAEKKASVDNSIYVLNSLTDLQVIFSIIPGNATKPLNEIASHHVNYIDSIITASYLKTLTDDIVNPDLTEFLNTVENGEKILSKLKVKYTISTPEQITSELVNHPDDANELFNNYFNWMASKIYRYCKSNTKFRGTEFDWIDKFNIKEEELYNFGYK